MSFLLSFVIGVFCCMATVVPIEHRFIGMAIVFAGGLAGMGGKS